MKISPNYTDLDVGFDLVAIKNKIDNTPPRNVLRAAEDMAEFVLEPLRNAYNFRIVSWYRSPTLEREYSKPGFFDWCRQNKLTCSDKNWFDYIQQKQHVTGHAVSIVSNDLEMIYEYLQSEEFDILQMRDNYIHISFVKGANRRLILK
jgi:hypothetical protein